MKNKVVLEKDMEMTTSSPDDPRLKKRWGYVAALPSEYLIHFRKGKINEKTSGQGGSCFKRLGDTTFIIPTSLKEIVFQANQLTKDNVDVRIRGMVVYRISSPLKICELLNFSNRQNAEEKLAHMIGDMCRSTSKWLVANMNVDECIRKRKEEIAEALKEEASRVVANSDTGWGVEIMTIDIQDVYIQDNEIFNAIQMMFKTEKIRESRLAQMEMERNLEMKNLEKERDLAESRKTNEVNKNRISMEIEDEKMAMQKSLDIRKLEQEREVAEHRKSAELDKVRHQAEIKDEEIKFSRQNEKQQFDLDRFRIEQNQEMAEFKFEKESEREKKQAELQLEKTGMDVDARKLVHDEEVRALEQKIRAENSASEISLEKLFIEKALPALAEVMAKNLSDVKISMFQHGENLKTPFSFILTELMQVFREVTGGVREQTQISHPPGRDEQKPGKKEQ